MKTGQMVNVNNCQLAAGRSLATNSSKWAIQFPVVRLPELTRLSVSIVLDNCVIQSMRILVAAVLLLAAVTLTGNACAQYPQHPLPYFSPTSAYGQIYDAYAFPSATRFLDSDEYLHFEYIEYWSHEGRKANYADTYKIEIISASPIATKPNNFRVALGLLPKPTPGVKTSKPEILVRSIREDLAGRLVRSVTPIMLRTHYDQTPNNVIWTDGYIVEAMVNSSGHGELAGSAYTPPGDSEAGVVVSLGRVLKKYVEGTAGESEIETAVSNVEQYSGQK